MRKTILICDACEEIVIDCPCLPCLEQRNEKWLADYEERLKKEAEKSIKNDIKRRTTKSS